MIFLTKAVAITIFALLSWLPFLVAVFDWLRPSNPLSLRINLAFAYQVWLLNFTEMWQEPL
jgi:hypothetical protein